MQSIEMFDNQIDIEIFLKKLSQGNGKRDIVNIIKKHYLEGYSWGELGEQYNTTRNNISGIVKRRLIRSRPLAERWFGYKITKDMPVLIAEPIKIKQENIKKQPEIKPRRALRRR